jgi:ABC-2 type transport system ATP-binding protein
MEEAQVLADRVVVLAGGRLVAEGTPDSLSAAAGEAIVSFRSGGVAERFHTATPTADLLPLLRAAVERGEELEGLTVTRPSLEDVYLQLTEEPA